MKNPKLIKRNRDGIYTIKFYQNLHNQSLTNSIKIYQSQPNSIKIYQNPIEIYQTCRVSIQNYRNPIENYRNLQDPYPKQWISYLFL